MSTAPQPAPRGAGLEEIVLQVEELSRRVAVLEQLLKTPAAEAHATPLVTVNAPAGEPPVLDGDEALRAGARLAPVAGISFLGLALAFLLRDFTERGLLPVTAGVAAGILYAAAWLVWASRSQPGESAAAVVRSVTSAMVLVPLLWEGLLRFRALSTWTTAALLVLFAVFGLAAAWRRNLAPVAWVTTLAGLGAAIALLMTTKDLLPFVTALLALAAAVEVSACFEHWLKERWVLALAADFAVLLLTFAAMRGTGWPPAYVPVGQVAIIAVQAALLGIYLAGTAARTLWRGFTITWFETAQCVVAFLLCTWGMLRVAHGHAAAVLTSGILTCLGAVVCYGVAFAFVERRHNDRNFYTYATFGLLLAVAGAWLLTAGGALATVLAVLAVLAVGVGRESGRLALKWHGVVFLALAAVHGGLAGVLAERLLGSAHPQGAPAGLGFWSFVMAALLCFAAIERRRHAAPRGGAYQALSALLAVGMGAAVLGAAAAVLGPVCATPGAASHPADACPTLLTAVLVLLAVAGAGSAARWGHRELAWAGYVFLALSAYKLVTQDFRQAQTLGIVVSLLLVGGSLVLLPRLSARSGAGSVPA